MKRRPLRPRRRGRKARRPHIRDYRERGLSGRSIRISLLGAFEVTCDRRPVRLASTAQRVLAVLALHDRPLRRTYVAGTLWPETPEERALANLRSALWRLQQPGWPLVETTSRDLRLAPEVDLDIRDAVAGARAVLDGSADDEHVEPRQLALVMDLLPDWYDDWIFFERERLRQLGLHALEHLCARLTDASRFGLALEAALAAVAGEPLRESAHRAVIRLHLAEGNTAEAIRHYRFYRTLLEDRLGLAPSSELDELVLGLTV